MVGVSASFCPLISGVVTDLDTVVCLRLSGRQPLVDVSVDEIAIGNSLLLVSLVGCLAVDFV